MADRKNSSKSSVPLRNGRTRNSAEKKQIEAAALSLKNLGYAVSDLGEHLGEIGVSGWTVYETLAAVAVAGRCYLERMEPMAASDKRIAQILKASQKALDGIDGAALAFNSGDYDGGVSACAQTAPIGLGITRLGDRLSATVSTAARLFEPAWFFDLDDAVLTEFGIERPPAERQAA